MFLVETMEDFVLCPVANIKPFILRANQIQLGYRLFRTGAKLYILKPFSGGDGYQHLNVYGLPKKSHKMIRVTIRAQDVENFRIQKVYKTKILDVVRQSWTGEPVENIENLIQHWKYWSEQPYSCSISSCEVAEAKQGDFILY